MSLRRFSGSARLAVLLVTGLSLVGVLVVSVASGSTAKRSAAAVGAQTFGVSVDGNAKGANETFIAYFPNQLRVHPGDRVVFTVHGPGEPHTVTFGTDVDDVLSAFDRLKPAQQNNPPKSVIALDAKLPQLLPQGPGDAVQDAANPCFVATGTVPANAACPAGDSTQPAFGGTQAYYNSGWKDPGQKFTVSISSGTRPGTYRFFCLLHREGMTGKLNVVPATTSIPSPSAVAATAAKELAAAQANLAAPLKALRQGKAPLPVALPGKHVVLAGSGNPQGGVGSISEFGPKVIHVPVGGYVIWYLIGPHSITFGSNKTDDDIRTVAPDGTVHLNPKALAPAGGPGEPAHVNGGSGKGISFKVVAESTWNGKGFHSSGVFGNSDGPPLIEGYRLRFTRAGTYKYICTVHDHMKGTVVVG
jgi:plastocyanin